MVRSCAALMLIALLGCLFARPVLAQPAGAGKMTDETLKHDGLERRFLVHDFSGGKRAPVVIILHGGGGNPENAVNMSQFDVIAEREHFITVYPGGTGALPKILTWNAVHCCAYARENKVDDVGFISDLIDKLVSSGRADPSRVYVTGMSNGGMMTHVLGEKLSDKIAAIGPIVGALWGDEQPPKGPVPAIIFVGQTDKNVPAAGGPLGGADKRGNLANLQRKPEDHDVAPDIAAADYWAKANKCINQPVEAFDKQGKMVEARWTCPNAMDVQFYRVPDNGHAWPGGRPGRAEADQPNPDFHASEIMWQFFRDHPRDQAKQ